MQFFLTYLIEFYPLLKECHQPLPPWCHLEPLQEMLKKRSILLVHFCFIFHFSNFKVDIIFNLAYFFFNYLHQFKIVFMLAAETHVSSWVAYFLHHLITDCPKSSITFLILIKYYKISHRIRLMWCRKLPHRQMQCSQQHFVACCAPKINLLFLPIQCNVFLLPFWSNFFKLNVTFWLMFCFCRPNY